MKTLSLAAVLIGIGCVAHADEPLRVIPSDHSLHYVNMPTKDKNALWCPDRDKLHKAITGVAGVESIARQKMKEGASQAEVKAMAQGEFEAMTTSLGCVFAALTDTPAEAAKAAPESDDQAPDALPPAVREQLEKQGALPKKLHSIKPSNRNGASGGTGDHEEL